MGPLLARLAPFTLFALAACDGDPTRSFACLAVLSPAVQVEVVDSVTLRPAAGGAEGFVRDGAYQDSLRVVGWTGPAIADSTAIRMAGAYERPGVYTVEIARPGYLVWRQAGVRAREGVCGVETVKLRARLIPTTIVSIDRG